MKPDSIGPRDSGARFLSAVELASRNLRWRLAVGRLPADVYLTPDDKTLFVGLTGDEHVEVYDVSQTPPKPMGRNDCAPRAVAADQKYSSGLLKIPKSAMMPSR